MEKEKIYYPDEIYYLDDVFYFRNDTYITKEQKLRFQKQDEFLLKILKMFFLFLLTSILLSVFFSLPAIAKVASDLKKGKIRKGRIITLKDLQEISKEKLDEGQVLYNSVVDLIKASKNKSKIITMQDLKKIKNNPKVGTVIDYRPRRFIPIKKWKKMPLLPSLKNSLKKFPIFLGIDKGIKLPEIPKEVTWEDLFSKK
jgi:hypothetical protein